MDLCLLAGREESIIWEGCTMSTTTRERLLGLDLEHLALQEQAQ